MIDPNPAHVFGDLLFVGRMDGSIGAHLPHEDYLKHCYSNSSCLSDICEPKAECVWYLYFYA